MEAEKGGDTSMFAAPNHSARAVALATVSSLPREAVLDVQKQVPSFNPAQEVQWGEDRLNHPSWKRCLTRAVVMGCRDLAYSLCGATGWIQPVNDVAFGAYYQRGDSDDIAQALYQWLADSAGKSTANVLLKRS